MKNSYVKGANTPLLLDLTIGQALDRAVKRWPRRDALVSCHEGISWSWGQLCDRVDAFAKGLLVSGIKRGDRAGIWATNKADWTVAQFATAKIGVILVNINPAYRPHELEYALNKVGAKCLITGSSFKSSNYISMLQELLPNSLTANRENYMRNDFPTCDWSSASARKANLEWPASNPSSRRERRFRLKYWSVRPKD